MIQKKNEFSSYGFCGFPIILFCLLLSIFSDFLRVFSIVVVIPSQNLSDTLFGQNVLKLSLAINTLLRSGNC